MCGLKTSLSLQENNIEHVKIKTSSRNQEQQCNRYFINLFFTCPQNVKIIIHQFQRCCAICEHFSMSLYGNPIKELELIIKIVQVIKKNYIIVRMTA